MPAIEGGKLNERRIYKSRIISWGAVGVPLIFIGRTT